jgi:hypothetical protein
VGLTLEMHALKLADHQRAVGSLQAERQRNKLSRQRKFELRGLRGDKRHPDAIRLAREARARPRPTSQVPLKVEGGNVYERSCAKPAATPRRALIKFARDEGLVRVTHAPTRGKTVIMPWERKKKVSGPRVRSSTEQSAAWWRNIVGRYRRMGELPRIRHEEAAAFAEVYAYAVPNDGEAVKRLLRALLLREGVEPNPGPRRALNVSRAARQASDALLR